jgi:hypothetical protein
VLFPLFGSRCAENNWNYLCFIRINLEIAIRFRIRIIPMGGRIAGGDTMRKAELV